jgi:hypothetical protein
MNKISVDLSEIYVNSFVRQHHKKNNQKWTTSRIQFVFKRVTKVYRAEISKQLDKSFKSGS